MEIIEFNAIFIYVFIHTLNSVTFMTITQRGNVGRETCLVLQRMVTVGNGTQDPLIQVTGSDVFINLATHPHYWSSRIWKCNMLGTRQP